MRPCLQINVSRNTKSKSVAPAPRAHQAAESSRRLVLQFVCWFFFCLQRKWLFASLPPQHMTWARPAEGSGSDRFPHPTAQQPQQSWPGWDVSVPPRPSWDAWLLSPEAAACTSSSAPGTSPPGYKNTKHTKGFFFFFCESNGADTTI